MTLIERIEGAEAGSRELDAEIIKLVSKGALAGEYWHLPSYSSSLDAAMSLCPQPPSFDLTHDHECQGGLWQCLVGDVEGWTVAGLGKAATPALALCAAALRAIGDTHDD